jgi:branched-chain amino acid transport system permease protein
VTAEGRSRLTAPALLLALVAFPLVLPDPYVLHVSNLAGLALLVTVGLNVLTGYAGQISIGHAAFYLIGAYTGALLVLRLHVPFLLTLPAAALAAVLVGWVVARPTLKLRGAYLAMATVGIVEIVQVVALNWTGLTGGALGLKDVPPPEILGLALRSERAQFYLVFAVVALGYAGVNRLLDSEIGRAWRAIRENETAAAAMGVDVARMKTLAFVVSAALAGLAGALYAPIVTYVSPYGFGFEESVALLSMALAGGLGWRWGPVYGVALLAVGQEYFQAFNEYQLVVYGLLLISVILFLPQGIAGAVAAAGRAWTRRRSSRLV